MISLPLLKRNLIDSLKLSVIFIAVMAMYTTVIIYMYDPSLSQMLDGYQEALPEMMAAAGMTGIATNLTEFIHIYLYGFIMLIFPMVFIIIQTNRLLVRYVDSGSLACFLATPNSRLKIILTQLLSLILSIAFLILIITMIGIICSEVMFPGDLDLTKYSLLNVGTFLLQLAIASIVFLAACLFNETRWYYMFGAGIPILFFLCNMLAKMEGDLTFLKYVTIYSLFPEEQIIAGNSEAFLYCGLLLVISTFFFTIGVLYFKRKDLPL